MICVICSYARLLHISLNFFWIGLNTLSAVEMIHDPATYKSNGKSIHDITRTPLIVRLYTSPRLILSMTERFRIQSVIKKAQRLLNTVIYPAISLMSLALAMPLKPTYSVPIRLIHTISCTNY